MLDSVCLQAVFNQASSTLTTAVIRPVTTPLDWTQPFACPDGAPIPPYDILLLTDCIFSISLIPHLISTLLSLSGPKTEVYCCYEIRDQVEYVDRNSALFHRLMQHINDTFIKDLSEHFTWKRITHSKLHPDFRNDMVEAIVCRPIRRKISELFADLS
jgi:hypothetical protein